MRADPADEQPEGASGAGLPETVARRAGRLLRCTEVRGDCSEWEVEVDGSVGRAVAYASLVGTLRPGDSVLLNTTAVELGLGTGGVHFVIAALDLAPEPTEPFAGREAGHLLKLRYTPLQLRVDAAEERHAAAFRAFDGLRGMPVLGAELLSQAAAAVLAARAAAPDLRIALVHMDTGALPVSFSRLIHRLRADGAVNAVISTGHAFGGDYEAVNVYSALILARSAADAGLVVVTQGPGNAGTGTEYGFSGLALAEALAAAHTLGGTAVLAPRLSEADPRKRHRGLSHHTPTILRCARVPVQVPYPPRAVTLMGGAELPGAALRQGPPDLDSLGGHRDALTSMGRGIEADPLFFEAATSAGRYVAGLAT